MEKFGVSLPPNRSRRDYFVQKLSQKFPFLGVAYDGDRVDVLVGVVVVVVDVLVDVDDRGEMPRMLCDAAR